MQIYCYNIDGKLEHRDVLDGTKGLLLEQQTRGRQLNESPDSAALHERFPYSFQTDKDLGTWSADEI
jgi:hypothetical protein